MQQQQQQQQQQQRRRCRRRLTPTALMLDTKQRALPNDNQTTCEVQQQQQQLQQQQQHLQQQQCTSNSGSRINMAKHSVREEQWEKMETWEEDKEGQWQVDGSLGSTKTSTNFKFNIAPWSAARSLVMSWLLLLLQAIDRLQLTEAT
ncbi:hypothetical protein ACLKA7_003629 [Drosophila subpalustris]